MRPRTRLSPELRRLAAVQSGVLSRHQLLALGPSRHAIARMLGEGLLTTVTPGIYSFGSVVGWTARAWAGVLLGGEHAVLGLEAAGYLHRLIGKEPEEITVFCTRRLTPLPGWRFIRSRRQGKDEPPRTGAEATVIDLCADRDEDAIAALLSDAVSSRLTTQAALRAEMARRKRLANGTLLREILGDVAAGAHSALERRFLISVERPHGLPTAMRQSHPGGRYRSDAWYRDHGVIVELDSTLHHRGAAAFRDMSRDNEHALAGLLTLRLGWGHVTGAAACETARLIASVLATRGWEGPLTPCSRCRRMHVV